MPASLICIEAALKAAGTAISFTHQPTALAPRALLLHMEGLFPAMTSCSPTPWERSNLMQKGGACMQGSRHAEAPAGSAAAGPARPTGSPERAPGPARWCS